MAPLPEALIGDPCPGLPESEADLSFQPGDEDRLWMLDFHWPSGTVPLGTTYVRDCYAGASRRAADLLPLPNGRGFEARLAGAHLYGSPSVIADEATIVERAGRLASRLPDLQARFRSEWAGHEAALDASFAAAGDGLVAARRHQQLAWDVHFEVMYPLVAGFVELRERLVGWGVDPQLAPVLLQGERTKILECDRALHGLADLARIHPMASASWRSAFDEVLATYGERTEGIASVHLPSWREDPTSPLGTIRTLLLEGAEHDFDAAEAALLGEREATADAVRSALRGGEALATFDDLLARNQSANFAWWNDEHNHAIDLRATIPLRRAALAVGDRAGLDAPDDAVFLFWDELVALAGGSTTAASVRGLIDDRRHWFAAQVARRGDLPKLAGTVPDHVDDPILLEVFGLHRHLLEAHGALGSGGPTRVTGLGVSGGKVTGRAVVLHDALLLFDLQPGDVLVCEATSPNWTPAFAKAVAVVCDLGGALTHAAITARDYRIPCVVGTGLATKVLRTGDLIEVDGDAGVVTLLKA